MKTLLILAALALMTGCSASAPSDQPDLDETAERDDVVASSPAACPASTACVRWYLVGPASPGECWSEPAARGVPCGRRGEGTCDGEGYCDE